MMTDAELKKRMEELLRGAPMMESTFCKVWEIPKEVLAGNPSVLVSYVVHCPNAHAFWSWWLVSVIHLRPVEGQPPAVLRYPEAQYEFSTIAIEPPERVPHNKLARPEAPFKLMMPMDVEVQFHGVTDEQAGTVCALSVRSMVQGVAYPDSDYRSAWEHLIRGTVEHLKAGKHPAN
jgi:hypothetical protein